MKMNFSLRNVLVLLLNLGCLPYVSQSLAAPLNVAETPLFLTTNVAPNIIVTLDDSGSMAQAYSPDDPCGGVTANCPNFESRYLKSAYYNPIYYNPKVTYRAPIDASGVALTTSFNKAWVNGYVQILPTIAPDFYDLATEYRPTARLTLSSSTKSHAFMHHYTATTDITKQVSYTPHADSGLMVGVNSGSTAPYFVISDFSNQDGSASGSNPGGNLLSVTVNGTASNYVGTYTGTCNNSIDPSNNYEYLTQISGATLTLCFRDSNTMYGKTVVVTHKNTGVPSAQPVTGADPTAAYYYVYNAANAGCSGTTAQRKLDNDCYTIQIVGSSSGADRDGNGSISAAEADERQNFANWYSFYRTRNLATIASASLAFSAFDSTTRVAFQALNTCRGSTSSLVTTDCDGWEPSATAFGNAIKPFAGTHKQNFYTWLLKLQTASATPLRQAMQRAGGYFQTTGEDSPYDDDLTTAGTVTATAGQTSCRKNFHILMTDGIWNGGINTAVNNADGALPAPYGDSNSDSLADIAYYYWNTDLVDLPGNDNNLLPYIVEPNTSIAIQNSNPKNDPKTTQHMVNFTVGLGLTPFLESTSGGTLTYLGSTYSGSYGDLLSGAKTWPVAAANADGNVADLWHAALNSRGQFFSAESPDNLVDAFTAVKNAIQQATPSAAALAANSTSIQTGAQVYQAAFNSKDWSGDLIAFSIGTGGSVGSAAWNAASKLPISSLRQIFTIDGGNGVTFDWASLNAAQKAYLNTDASGVTDTLGSSRLDWLRGVQTQEVVLTNGVVTSGVFRKRSSVLGDIINSDPAYAFADDFGYATQVSTEASSYASYVANKATRTAAVFVGANDGMLHAFQADASANAGVELFAFVPNNVFANLSKLTDTGYAHKFYVDGGPTVGDAYLSSSWTTLLVGGLNGGGRSIYALNINNVTSPSSSMVRWEYTETDLGLTYSKPQIAKLNNGKWVAIFGNGYNSTAERAYLYVVDLADGTLVKKIAAGSATANGLSTPALHDTNNDKIMDFAYAGDLQGNLWKFDLTSFADQTTPQFVARNGSGQVQAITSQPVVGGHPNGNVLVYFGTGLYLQGTDPLDTNRQTFYAIWDNGLPITSIDRSELQAQTIDNQTSQTFTLSDNGTPADTTDDITQTSALRETSANTVDWTVMKGWYMDFDEPTSNGERVVTQALLKHDRVIFLTLIPSTDTCNAGGVSWLMELDAVTGVRTAGSSFDFNNDGKFDSADNLTSNATASGVQTTVGITKPPAWFTGTGGKDFKIMTGTTGGIQSLGNKGDSPGGGGGGGGTLRRTYWIQIQ
ncbi:MAG: PilC/PilY family type IV pilus protein [Thiobacillus sp.]